MSEPIKCFMVEMDGGKWRLSGEDAWNEFRALPIGAMWFAPWLDKTYQPQLEHVLIVRTPGGDWTIDGRANNCTEPDDRTKPGHRKHHCWIIQGSIPDVTVDKNGVTCKAGGGSILQGSYHGFLRGGYLVEA